MEPSYKVVFDENVKDKLQKTIGKLRHRLSKFLNLF